MESFMNKNLRLLFFLVTTMFISFACTPTDSGIQTVSKPTNSTSTNTPVKEPTVLTNTATAPIPTNTPPSIDPTDAPTPVESLIAEETIYACSLPPRIFDAKESLGIVGLTRMNFITEEILEIEGWGPRSIESSLTPDEQRMLGDMLKIGQFNLAEDTATMLETDFAFLLPNPCPDDCPFEVISQSPDAKWQLVQIRRRIWLISESEKVQLVDFVPSWITWQWSVDGAFLWFKHTEPEYGSRAPIVQLKTPPVVTRPEVSEDNPLHPTNYHVVFSPQDNTILSTQKSLRDGTPGNGELYTFDLTESLTNPVSVETVPNLVKVEWNETTQEYLLITAYEDYVEIKRANEMITVKLFLNTFDDLISSEVIQHNVPFAMNAVSSSGERLAVILGSSRIFVFDCEEN